MERVGSSDIDDCVARVAVSKSGGERVNLWIVSASVSRLERNRAVNQAIWACSAYQALVKRNACLPFTGNLAWIRPEIGETDFRRIVVRR